MIADRVLPDPGFTDVALCAQAHAPPAAGLSASYAGDVVPPGTARPPRTETAPEVTCADRIAPFPTDQPDLQYILIPAGAGEGRPVFAALFRIRREWSRP